MTKGDLTAAGVLEALQKVGLLLDWPGRVEVLLVGGAAGMSTKLLGPSRTTKDCDIADFHPAEAAVAVERAAESVAEEMALPKDWLNDKARQLNLLPDGWRVRRKHVASFGKLEVYAASRLDLLAMKVFAHRAPDRQDLAEMRITSEEIEFVRKYLRMLRVPSRRADLDQVAAAEHYLRLVERESK